MEEEEERGASASEEGDQGKSDPADNDSDDTLPGAAQEEAAASLEPLAEGSTLSVGSTELPVRTLFAMAIFVVVFLAAWMILWAVGGGLGLGLGWILAGVAGTLAVKLYADRVR